LQKAAEKGFAPAQYGLASAYHFGHGIPQNDNEAVKWCRKAAEQTYPSAQYGLGLAYYKGRGVIKDAAETARWWQKAADQGNWKAQRALGIAYQYGQGVAKNYVIADMWYNLDVKHSSDLRDALEKLMTKEQIKEAKSKSLDWHISRPPTGT